MKNSVKDVKTLLVKGEKLSIEQLAQIKGGDERCGTPSDPRRCL